MSQLAWVYFILLVVFGAFFALTLAVAVLFSEFRVVRSPHRPPPPRKRQSPSPPGHGVCPGAPCHSILCWGQALLAAR